MRVMVTSPKGKDKLVQAFKDAGAYIVRTLSERPDLIIPTVDEELPFFAENAPWFRSQGIQVMVSDPNAVFQCRDKAEFSLWCMRHGIPTPQTFHRNFVVKPRFGKGSKGIIKVPTRQYITQVDCSEYPEVSVDYFADFDGKVVSMLPRYRLNVVDGESKDFKYVPMFPFETVKKLGEEMGLVGHNVIQGFMMAEDVFYVTEVNPRFGGGSWMTFSDFNSPRWLVENSACSLTKKQYITPLDSSLDTTLKTENTRPQ